MLTAVVLKLASHAFSPEPFAPPVVTGVNHPTPTWPPNGFQGQTLSRNSFSSQPHLTDNDLPLSPRAMNPQSAPTMSEYPTDAPSDTPITLDRFASTRSLGLDNPGGHPFSKRPVADDTSMPTRPSKQPRVSTGPFRGTLNRPMSVSSNDNGDEMPPRPKLLTGADALLPGNPVTDTPVNAVMDLLSTIFPLSIAAINSLSTRREEGMTDRMPPWWETKTPLGRLLALRATNPATLLAPLRLQPTNHWVLVAITTVASRFSPAYAVELFDPLPSLKNYAPAVNLAQSVVEALCRRPLEDMDIDTGFPEDHKDAQKVGDWAKQQGQTRDGPTWRDTLDGLLPWDDGRVIRRSCPLPHPDGIESGVAAIVGAIYLAAGREMPVAEGGCFCWGLWRWVVAMLSVDYLGRDLSRLTEEAVLGLGAFYPAAADIVLSQRDLVLVESSSACGERGGEDRGSLDPELGRKMAELVKVRANLSEVASVLHLLCVRSGWSVEARHPAMLDAAVLGDDIRPRVTDIKVLLADSTEYNEFLKWMKASTIAEPGAVAQLEKIKEGREQLGARGEQAQMFLQRVYDTVTTCLERCERLNRHLLAQSSRDAKEEMRG